jgi:RNA polymerase subunit RPABC4/transcription elongation factor Spt4
MTLPRSDDPFTCPACGAEVPAKAKACPECGSDEKTGWSENTIYDGTGIEDPKEFDYEDWKRRELGSRGKVPRMFWIWWLVAVGLAIFFLWAFVLKRIMEAL